MYYSIVQDCKTWEEKEEKEEEEEVGGRVGVGWEGMVGGEN